MKALCEKLGPQSVYAVIVLTLLSFTLNDIHTIKSENGILKAEVTSGLELVEYRLEQIEYAVRDHIESTSPTPLVSSIEWEGVDE
jgi:hypothetical protein